jgi:hypothetical protein
MSYILEPTMLFGLPGTKSRLAELLLDHASSGYRVA